MGSRYFQFFIFFFAMVCISSLFSTTLFLSQKKKIKIRSSAKLFINFIDARGYCILFSSWQNLLFIEIHSFSHQIISPALYDILQRSTKFKHLFIYLFIFSFLDNLLFV